MFAGQRANESDVLATSKPPLNCWTRASRVRIEWGREGSHLGKQ